MKSIAIIFRPDTEEAEKLALVVKAKLENEQEGMSLNVLSSMDLHDGCFSEMTPTPELVLVLGGDGTYLAASRSLRDLDIPIVGVNLGSLGFLTENRADDIYPLLDKALNGKLSVYERTLLQLEISENGTQISEKHALNDIVIERGSRAQLVRIKVFCDDQIVVDLKADGLIVSTATGSTAYNLAAGGPILHPQTPAITITPISPHSLTSRPLVFPDDREIRLQLSSGPQKAQLTIDGQVTMELTPEFELKIKKNKSSLKVLKDPYHNYFELLREKLKFGERS